MKGASGLSKFGSRSLELNSFKPLNPQGLKIQGFESLECSTLELNLDHGILDPDGDRSNRLKFQSGLGQVARCLGEDTLAFLDLGSRPRLKVQSVQLGLLDPRSVHTVLDRSTRWVLGGWRTICTYIHMFKKNKKMYVCTCIYIYVYI